MGKLDDYEERLLAGWEEVHHKSKLSLWILLALKDVAKYMASIKEFISHATNQQIQPDDKSVYRALRRFRDSDLIEFELQPNAGGPDLKIYQLTKTGSKVLESFLERNIIDIFYQPRNRKLIEEGMK